MMWLKLTKQSEVVLFRNIFSKTETLPVLTAPYPRRYLPMPLIQHIPYRHTMSALFNLIT